ncbi:MAG: hypothetical protein H0T68_01765 [Gemmatimonadales bacterium]|nr:hypothetical protein [Gemmatimonadales bacterium]
MRLTAPLALALALSTIACDLLPVRGPAVAATPPADSAAARPDPRRSPRRPAPSRRDGAGVSEGQAFDQIRRGLRRLVAAEQGFYAENGTYTADLERLGYRAEGQTAVRFLWLKREGWAVSGTHPTLPGQDCVIHVGLANGPPTTLKYVRSAREGVTACDENERTRRNAAAAPGPPLPPVDTSSALDAVRPTVQMAVDLRNLVLSQNAYLAAQGIYSRRTERLALQFLWHREVTVRLLSADARSWAARATHASRPGKSCVIWYGPVPARPATAAQRRTPARAGVPVCDD